MRRTFNKSRITRRTLIASTAALPCTALAYQAPISEPDSAEEARLFDEAEACERKIMSTPPTTPGGVLAQLEYAIEDSLCGGHLGGDFDGLDTLMFKNIVKALARGVS